jgi:hypothetical protein
MLRVVATTLCNCKHNIRDKRSACITSTPNFRFLDTISFAFSGLGVSSLDSCLALPCFAFSWLLASLALSCVLSCLVLSCLVVCRLRVRGRGRLRVGVRVRVRVRVLNASSLRKTLTHECCINEGVSQSYVGKSVCESSLNPHHGPWVAGKVLRFPPWVVGKIQRNVSV